MADFPFWSQNPPFWIYVLIDIFWRNGPKIMKFGIWGFFELRNPRITFRNSENKVVLRFNVCVGIFWFGPGAKKGAWPENFLGKKFHSNFSMIISIISKNEKMFSFWIATIQVWIRIGQFFQAKLLTCRKRKWKWFVPMNGICRDFTL